MAGRGAGQEAALLAALEEAAHVLATTQDSAARREAEGVLLRFQQTENPYSACQHVLAHSSSQLVLFHAVAAMQEGLVREWRLLDPAQVEAVRKYLLEVAVAKDVEYFVVKRLMTAVAVVFKRSWVEPGREESCNKAFFQETEWLLQGSTKNKLIGCMLVASVLEEFGSTSRSTAVGLAWEKHFHAKRHFEEGDLRQVCVHFLKLLHSEASGGEPNGDVLFRVLEVLRLVFEWQFTSHQQFRLAYTFEGGHSYLFRPGPNWREVLTPDVVQLLFAVYPLTRRDDRSALTAMTILKAAAALDPKSAFAEAHDAALAYLNAFAVGTTELLSGIFHECAASGEIVSEDEAVGLGTLAGELVAAFGRKRLGQLNPDTVQQFLTAIRALTETCMCREERLYVDAFNSLLLGWVTLVSVHNVEEAALASLFAETAGQIFEAYVRSRLTNAASPECLQEVDSLALSDREEFGVQLESIACLGRSQPGKALLLLHVATQSVLQELKGGPTPEVLGALFEKAHWLVLISTFLLTDMESFVSVRPPSLVRYSSSCPRPEEDGVVVLVGTVLQLCQFEHDCLTAGQMGSLSPLLSATLVFFLRRWCGAYLMPEDSDSLSVNLRQAYGSGAAFAEQSVEFLTQKVIGNFVGWQSEEEVLEDTRRLLKQLVSSKTIRQLMLKSPCAEQLASVFIDDASPLYNLPPEVQRDVACALCKVLGAAPEQTRTRLLGAVLQAAQTRLFQLLRSPELAAHHNRVEIKTCVRIGLEACCGFVEGVTQESLPLVLEYLGPFVRDAFTRLLQIYIGVPEMVVHIFDTYVEIISYLPRLDLGSLVPILRCIFQSLQLFQQENADKTTAGELAEEEHRAELAALVRLLNEVALQGDTFPELEEQTAEISLFGLGVVQKVIKVELLEIPEVCDFYFNFLHQVCEQFAPRVYQSDSAVLGFVASSVELGLKMPKTSVIKTALHTLLPLEAQHIREKFANPDFVVMTKHFMKLLCDLFILQPFDRDLMTDAAACLFALICCDQSHFVEIANTLLQQQAEEALYSRLGGALNELVTGNGLVMAFDRVNKKRFCRNLEEFLISVRGFLLVK